MATKTLRGFRLKPKQDGTGKVTLERVPYFGLDASAKIRRKKSKKIRPIQGGLPGLDRERPEAVAMAGLFTPIKK